MREKLIKVFKNYNFELNNEQIDKFEKYYNFLIEENKKFNLTSITDEDGVIYKHFLDSILPIDNIAKNATLVDVGTGAGFPGIPIKIMRPDIEVVLVDSLQKRVNFLNQVIELLNLTKITAFHARIEDFALKNREKFDYAVSRAVAQINTLSEYMIPLTKIGGQIIMYKSQKIEEEINEGKKAIEVLGGKIKNNKNIKINEINAERNLLFIEKIKNTPKQYPRGKNLPKLKPIK